MRVAGAGAGPPEGRVGAGPVEADPADGGVGLFLASRVGRGGGREGGREGEGEGRCFFKGGKEKVRAGGEEEVVEAEKKKVAPPKPIERREGIPICSL